MTKKSTTNSTPNSPKHAHHENSGLSHRLAHAAKHAAHLDTDSKPAESRTIVKAGAIAIITNLLLAVFKIIVGVISGSIAVMSDAAHGLLDSISGIIVVISEKLANHKRYAKNREKIERIATIIIAIIIIIVGIHILIESIEAIIEPEEVDYSVPTMIVLVASVVAKLLLGLYLKRQGRLTKSTTLLASGTESLNDVIISVAVLVSALIYLIWHVDIEAYVSIAISAVIIKLGLEFF